MKLYNTLSKKKETFKPIKKGKVGMYSCGPTVYSYQHIGNLRTAILNDILKRALQYNGFKVKHVMNITDVDDKTIKASIKMNVSLKKLTRYYEKIFLNDLEKLNIIKPDLMPRATENIDKMIKMIDKLLKKGIAYKVDDGVYFSINKFKGYGNLAGLSKINKRKERVKNDEYAKKQVNDFSLWKFYTKDDGDVYWDAPFGKGRPGWHIECSSMSTSNLGDRIDIHTGGSDLIFPHHTNEIAQSESATGKKFVNYWVHGAFLNMKEEKMSKSKGNIFTLKEIENNYNPIHFRYLVLQSYYRKPLSFTLDNLDSAKTAFERLKRKIIEIKKDSHKGKDETGRYSKEFSSAIDDDLNIPKALSVFLKVVDDFNYDVKKKLALLIKMDSVLGLGVKDMKDGKIILDKEVKDLIKKRENARRNKDWAEADILRNMIKERGFLIEDSADGFDVRKA